MLKRILATGCCLAAALLIASCDSDPTGTGMARVQILLTDAPSDYIQSAEVSISRVYLMRGDLEEAEGGVEGEEIEGPNKVDLFNDAENPKVYDLLTLRDGLVADLTDLLDVPEGSYGKLRLVVDEAVVTLNDPYVFRSGEASQALKTPSAHKSGLKVKLAEVIRAEAGTTTIVTVDFDVEQNFKIQGDPESPDGIKGVLFTPSLKELKREDPEG